MDLPAQGGFGSYASSEPSVPEGVFRVAMDQSAIGMALVAPDGSFLVVNPALCEMLGRSEEELRASTWQELTHPEDVAVDAALVDEILEGGRHSYRLAKRYLKPDGSVVFGDLAVACVRTSEGAVDYFISQIVDVTAERVATDRYRLLAENVSDVVALGSNDGVLEWVSPSITEAMGWDPEALVGQPFRDLVHPDELAQVAATQARVRKGHSGGFEARLRHADGSYTWMNILVKPVLDDAGQVVGRVAAWRKALTKVERDRFRAAMDAELDGHVFLEAVREDGSIVDFVYVDANAAAAEYLGSMRDGLIGSRLLARFPGQRTSGLFDQYVTTVETGAPLILEDVALRSDVDGEVRHYDFRGLRTGDGLSLTWRDVTDKALAAEALATSEARYQLLAENASDVVFQGDSQAVVQWVSPSVRDVLGLSPEEIVGRHVMSMIEADDVPVVRQASAAVNSGERVSYRARYRRADGSLRWAEVTARPVLDAAGELTSRVGSLRDVNEQVTAELALADSERQAVELAARYEEARNEALEANIAKTAFLSRMSHELRTPLNAVLGFAQLLAMDPLTEEQQEAVQHIRVGGRHLLDLVSEILDISRIEAGRLTLSMESVGVADAVSEALDLVRPLAGSAGVSIAPLDASGCDVSVWADRQRVIQVLLNFLSNAVKYNRPGGSVAVACDRSLDGLVAIRVTDTGIGIAEQNLSRLFRPFDRLGAERSAVEGTGIGLMLADALARVMSGRVEVSSREGVGSTFTLVLPSAEPAAPMDLPIPMTSMASRGAARRVIYIEDNPANQHLMHRILGLRPNATLTMAERGAPGLELALAEPPDLILLDLHLPDLSGDEVLRRLRLNPATAHVPVVIVTADASIDVRHRLELLGADGLLTKPLDVDDVLAWVDDPNGQGPA